MRARVLERCQRALPDWGPLPFEAFAFEDPKGFSSFTMTVRCLREGVEPSAVLYRQLEEKENAILDFDTERRVFLLLGERDIAAHCYRYESAFRI